MRRLRVVVAMSGAVPAITAAALVPVAACGARTAPGDIGDGSLDADAKKEAAKDGPFFPPLDATEEEVGTPPVCTGPGATEQTVIVSLPPPNVPADPGVLCSINVSPVGSNDAARVTLTAYSPKAETAIGYIAVPSQLQPLIVGQPALTVVQATDPALFGMQVAAMGKTAGGYTFQASWPSAFGQNPGAIQMTVKTSFAIKCADGGTQTVEALTILDLCIDGNTVDWASSGDSCTICTLIAEMAPSPIVSDNRGDEMPLGRVIRLRVRELARVGRSLLLLAENDGGEGTEHEWSASAGEIALVASDVALWRIPERERDVGEPAIQVAVWNDTGAAVASYAWDLGGVG